ncbi:ABC transporter ATP-binding protein [Parendozoicomonas haliclonae]|uniref:Fe(3+) ions import ATP-binding protein FbpC n=1 Tax=Parendozoicomonas haliclonae TaxID=1960125 RepID=A0A1X7AP99_9GAMM|nr:ABC transporter ATP-binding protein [Parendozoicomonas haliclonae]SMA49973.1 Fe(3+) ions import ATP-binding protein FbpC [Parendozoicomonas haliclonae]
MSTLLDVCDISCSYRSHLSGQQETVVHNLSFQVGAGENICLLGPSGCGKTTTLRAIAGFETLDTGEISLAGTTLSKFGFTLPPERRQLGMVFQDYALFPHLSVADNIRFGLSGSAKQQNHRVDEMLSLTGLEAFASRNPQELSGGQQQRVALARALAPAPRLLLLDEPFSNLDSSLRQSLSHEVRNLLKLAGTSAIMVTHDQDEAFAFADKIGLFDQGRISQWGTAAELYQQPANAFVASFIGEGTLLKVIARKEGFLETAVGQFPAESMSQEQHRVLIRPDQLTCCTNLPHNARVIQNHFRGNHQLLTVVLPSEEELLVEAGADMKIQPGDSIQVHPKGIPVRGFHTEAI